MIDYLKRSEGSWQWISILLILLHFVVPFVLLIIRDLKRSRRALGAVATFLFLIRIVKEEKHMAKPHITQSKQNEPKNDG